jgi:hypothetical protein
VNARSFAHRSYVIHLAANAVPLLLLFCIGFVENSMFVSDDLYTDAYKLAIFRADPLARMGLPVMSDSDFMRYLNDPHDADDRE